MDLKINVNPKPCDCGSIPYRAGEHSTECASLPILIPCRIPRSVTFIVAAGECDCWPAQSTRKDVGHHLACPARPIRVVCSIGGDTWEESEVSKCASVRDERGNLAAPSYATPDEYDAALCACRDRWALVKALVLGYTAWDYTMSRAKAIPLATITAMIAQRDAVFTALADMVRAEEAHRKATIALVQVLKAAEPKPATNPNAGSYALKEGGTENAENGLAAYVEILVEQVSSLP